MSTLSVRLPKDLEKALPKSDRSAWAIRAMREQLRRDRIEAIAAAAAENAERDLDILSEWEAVTPPLPGPRRRKASKR